MKYKWINNILLKLNKHAETSNFPYTLFGCFMMVNYLYDYPWWLLSTKQSSYPFWGLHITAFILCTLLALNKLWPQKLKKLLALYWYITVIWTLTFSTSFAFFNGQFDNTRYLVINAMLASFLLILIVDWISFVIILFVGVILGALVQFIVAGEYTHNFSAIKGQLSIFAWTILIGILFSRNASRQRLNLQLKKQLETIQTVCASIAHELRTPLRTIQSGANGFKKYLPQLLETYDIAKKENLPIPKINIVHQQALMSALNNINTEILASFTFIDMLLTNVNENSIGKNLKVCSIEQCVQMALERYPFNDNERKLVHCDIKHNFQFQGNEELMIHVLFNLLKNALYYLKEANKGEISIWTETDHKYNILHFKDTGKGIDEKILPHIFDRFFSRTYHGTGIGLAFCKLVMQSFGGDIRCHSVVDEYAEFMMTFPKHI